MPQAGSKIAHTAGTDHRVRRRPDTNPRSQEPPRGLYPGEVPLAHFHQGLIGARDGETARDLGLALTELGKDHPALAKSEGLAALETALAKAPERELTLTYAAALATALERKDDAIAYWQRAVRVDPWNSQYHYRLAQLLAIQGRWSEAEEASASAFRLNPFAEEIRLLRVTCLIRTGNKDQAWSEFQPLLTLKPGDQTTLRRWFDEQTQK